MESQTEDRIRELIQKRRAGEVSAEDFRTQLDDLTRKAAEKVEAETDEPVPSSESAEELSVAQVRQIAKEARAL
jgi:hypothetical protein